MPKLAQKRFFPTFQSIAFVLTWPFNGFYSGNSAERRLREATNEPTLAQLRELASERIIKEELPRSMRLKVALELFYDRADIYCPDPNEISHEAVYIIELPLRPQQAASNDAGVTEILHDCYFAPCSEGEAHYPHLRIQWAELPWYRRLFGRGIRVLAP